MADPVADLTGTTVGRFSVRARLGAGGMGEVYRADDTKLKRSVALKRMAPHLRSDARYRQRFLKEAERASRLTDQHIAGLYDVLEEGGETFLVMEYVEGETLRQRLQRPLSIEEFLEIAAQCGEALVAAHARGLVHRDLKPENIMLTPAGQVKVLDFGVAKRLPRPEETAATETFEPSTAGGLSGTPAYMAPETLLEKEADGRADIFSLGVVFYEALTGRHPFLAGSFVATSDRILREAPAPLLELNPRAPAELERIVAKMLAKRPAERYQTAADLLVDLRAVQRGERIELRPSPPAPQPWYRRRVLRVTAALVVLAALVVAWRYWPLPAERVSVVVLPFSNKTGVLQLDEYKLTLTQFLVHSLAGSPNLRVFPYEQLLDIVQPLIDKGEDTSSPQTIQAVASFSNSRFVVVPVVHAIGNTLRVEVEFRDGRTGKTVGSTKAERRLSGSPQETLYSLLDELATEIEGYFKDLGRGVEYEARTAGGRPRTATAALYFNEGQNALARGQYARALEALQKAVQEDRDYALAYAWMGKVYGHLGYDDKARAAAERAEQLITADTPVTDAYFIEANLAERRYDLPAAEQKYLELIRLYPDDAAWHAGLADVYERQGLSAKAVASYEEALRRDPHYIVVHQQLGGVYSRTGKSAEALTHVERALDLYRKLGNREGEAAVLLVLAEVFRQKGEYDRAHQQADASRKLFDELKSEFGRLWATKVTGDIYFSEGNNREARRFYQQVLSGSGELRSNRFVVQSLMNTGVTYLREGDLSRAVEYYERSVDQKWSAHRERALASANLGVLYIEYGPDPERGFQLAQDALETFRTMGDALWEARSTTTLGIYFMNTGRYSESVEHFQQAERLSRSRDFAEGIALANYNLGRCYFFQNDYARALDALEAALNHYREQKDPFGVALAQILLGWTHARLGDRSMAQALLKEGIQVSQQKGYGELLPDAYTAVGELHRESGDAERARQSFRKGSELWKEPSVSESSIEARSYFGLMEAERGDRERGLSLCRQAAERARRLQHLHTLARTLINLAQVHVLRKEYARAIEDLDEVPVAGERTAGLELRARAFYLRGRALEGMGRSQEAKAAFSKAREAIRSLHLSLAAAHRESFAARKDIQPLFP